jgi:hypothetical protein
MLVKLFVFAGRLDGCYNKSIFGLTETNSNSFLVNLELNLTPFYTLAVKK